MRLTLLCVLMVVALSCSTDKQTNTYTVPLTGIGGSVSFEIPADLDTAYSWMNLEQCVGSRIDMYRFSRKYYRTPAETDWFWGRKKTDSLYNFTIRWYRDDFDDYVLGKLPTVEQLKIQSKKRLQYYRERSGGTLDVSCLLADRELINDRDIAIEIYSSKGPGAFKLTDNIEAVASHRGRSVLFQASCEANNCDGFIPAMHKIIKTIHFNDGMGVRTNAGNL